MGAKGGGTIILHGDPANSPWDFRSFLLRCPCIARVVERDLGKLLAIKN